MRVISKRAIREIWSKYADSEQQLKTWYKEVSKAKWISPQELKRNYPKSSILKGNRVVFNIYGNKYRLVVKMN